jgi:1-acyl-sn-glycerol-3-phosphate acyltransferase
LLNYLLYSLDFHALRKGSELVKMLRRCLRLCLLAGHVVLGLIVAMISLRKVESTPPDAPQQHIIHWWLKRAATLCGLQIRTRGLAPGSPVLVVANHVSWLDILAIASVLPVTFVSKIEIRSWPLFGRLACRAGTLFIHRGGKNAANQATEQITWYLLRGQSVAMFPEGTTSNGQHVRRFHARLFGAAIHADTLVQPLAIRYPHPGGVHPAVPFVDKVPFYTHGWRVLGEKCIVAEIVFCTPILARRHVRRILAEKARIRIKRIVTGQHDPPERLDEHAETERY